MKTATLTSEIVCSTTASSIKNNSWLWKPAICRSNLLLLYFPTPTSSTFPYFPSSPLLSLPILQPSLPLPSQTFFLSTSHSPHWHYFPHISPHLPYPIMSYHFPQIPTHHLPYFFYFPYTYFSSRLISSIYPYCLCHYILLLPLLSLLLLFLPSFPFTSPTNSSLIFLTIPTSPALNSPHFPHFP